MNRQNARGRGRGNAPFPAAAPVPVLAPVPVVRFTILSKEFIQLGGTTFTGSEGIIEAQRWLRNTEMVFTGLDITDAQKRQLAAWQLKNAARDWWESVTAHTVETTITWAQFR